MRVADVAVTKGLAGGPFGSSLGTKDYVESGVPVIRGVNLGSHGKFDPREFVFVSKSKFEHDLARNSAEPGDVVFTQRGTLGQVGIVPAAPYDKYVISQSQMRLRVNCELALAEFIYYQFKSSEMLVEINNRAITTGVPHINLGILGDLTISLPSLDVQQGIVSVLGVLDDKIAVNDSIAEACRKLMTLKYSDAFTSGVRTIQISKIAELYDGPHATPEKTESGPWFLSISSLDGGRLVLDQSAHLSEDNFKQWTRRVTPRFGDVLFSYETRLGEAALMPAGIRACLGRRMALLRPREVGSRTLLQAFLSPSFQETIRQYSVHGATVDRIPLAEFPSWRIELPAQDPEQLESILGPLDDLAQQRERENETLAGLRDTLLPGLMSGEIRVRDAEKVVEDVT